MKEVWIGDEVGGEVEVEVGIGVGGGIIVVVGEVNLLSKWL